ncbi:hypothetical protein PtA15_2A631 [Puccinia triticina]|uniref:Uncharacterized protein n=1 Tax=Puccinia triticina TaxID=208348 RepID=A0ABY7CCA6_9BASI|nr:uncharacterized protein PtA15_2A631 [Puccinia triticina]WAQ82314.1 hypothetical protein PtA15_2A631 [Puccinia triticina]
MPKMMVLEADLDPPRNDTKKTIKDDQAVTGDSANDAPALSRGNISISVKGATHPAHGAANIFITKWLSTIVDRQAATGEV